MSRIEQSQSTILLRLPIGAVGNITSLSDFSPHLVLAVLTWRFSYNYWQLRFGPSILSKILVNSCVATLVSWPLASKSRNTPWQQLLQRALRCNCLILKDSSLQKAYVENDDLDLNLDFSLDRCWTSFLGLLQKLVISRRVHHICPSCLNPTVHELGPSFTLGLPPSSVPGPRTTVFPSLPLLEKTLFFWYVLKC